MLELLLILCYFFFFFSSFSEALFTNKFELAPHIPTSPLHPGTSEGEELSDLAMEKDMQAVLRVRKHQPTQILSFWLALQEVEDSSDLTGDREAEIIYLAALYTSVSSLIYLSYLYLYCCSKH